jgi:hypothetical protein
MKRKDVVRGPVFCILVAVIMLGGMAVRAEAASLRLSMADFTMDGELFGGDTRFIKYFYDGYITGTEDSHAACLVAPVKFPTSAKKVKSAVVYVEDHNGSDNFWAYLYGVDMTTGTVTDLGGVESSGSSTSIQALTLDISDPILLKTFQYYLGICVYGSQYFYGAQFTY